jgi:tetratricopeptide (TPR) repeat protein
MEDSSKAATKIWVTYGLAGFLLGVCLVSILTVGLATYQTSNPPPTQTSVPMPTIAAQALLDEAYQALYENNPQHVLDILEPHLEEFTDSNELVKALEYLGGAELSLGHYQLATVYFERLIQLSPTPENYMTLARVYDAGGDLEKAVEYYMIYLNSDSPSLTDDVRAMVQQRIDQIQSILTGISPTPAP